MTTTPNYPTEWAARRRAEGWTADDFPMLWERQEVGRKLIAERRAQPHTPREITSPGYERSQKRLQAAAAHNMGFSRR